MASHRTSEELEMALNRAWNEVGCFAQYRDIQIDFSTGVTCSGPKLTSSERERKGKPSKNPLNFKLCANVFAHPEPVRTHYPDFVITDPSKFGSCLRRQGEKGK